MEALVWAVKGARRDPAVVLHPRTQMVALGAMQASTEVEVPVLGRMQA